MLLSKKHDVQFVNINDQLTDAEGRFLPGYSSDGLHLERPAYDVWAKRLRVIFEEVLGPPGDFDQAPEPTGIPAKQSD